MSKFITVGKRFVPREHIAFVEPYDPAANPNFQTTREFRGRLVMTNRNESVLIEETPDAFAQANGFRMIPIDRVATNPAVQFRVETFVPAEGFVPSKGYLTRLLWRDPDGNDQSKLLLTEPETVLAIAVTGEAPQNEGNGASPLGKIGRGMGRKRQRPAKALALHP